MVQNPELSIIVPTLEEASNIPILAAEISLALKSVVSRWELIIVDDDSRDGTLEVCERLITQGTPLQLVIRNNERGLATAVIEGFSRAKAPIWVVMDADLSHNPVFIPMFYEAIRHGSEFVLGSRYLPGGGTDDKWTVYRFLNSKIATLLALPLVSTSDPMSGFFALPRSLWKRCPDLSPVGYKIALEIMVKCKPQKLTEIPIYFRSRTLGKSKLNIKQQILYLMHLGGLYRYKWFADRRLK